MTGAMRARRSDENPRLSGLAVGSSAVQVEATGDNARTSQHAMLRSAFISFPPLVLGRCLLQSANGAELSVTPERSVPARLRAGAPEERGLPCGLGRRVTT